MTLKQVLITPQADGTAASTGNTGAASVTANGGSTITWQSSKVRLNAVSGQSCQLRYAANASSNLMQFTFRFTTPSSWPTAGNTVWSHRNTTPARALSLTIGPTGNLYLNDFANTQTTLIAAGLMANSTEYVCKCDVVGGSTTASVLKLRLETVAGVLIGSEINKTNCNFSTVTLNNWDLGSTAASAFIFDARNVQVNDGTSAGYIADYVSSTPLADTTLTVTASTNPTTVGGTDGSISASWTAVPNAVSYEAAIAAGSVTSGFTGVAATSPWSFTGLAAGAYTVAVRAMP